MENFGPPLDQVGRVMNFQSNAWDCFLVRVMMNHSFILVMIQRNGTWQVLSDTQEAYTLSKHGRYMFRQPFGEKISKIDYDTDQELWNVTLPCDYGTRNIFETAKGDILLFYANVPLLLVNGKNGDIVRVIDNPGNIGNHFLVGETYGYFLNGGPPTYNRQWFYIHLNPCEKKALALPINPKEGLVFSSCGTMYLTFTTNSMSCFWTDTNTKRWTTLFDGDCAFYFDLSLQYVLLHHHGYVDIYDVVHGAKCCSKEAKLLPGIEISKDRSFLYGLRNSQLQQIDLFPDQRHQIRALCPSPSMYRWLINKLFHF